MYPEFLLPDGAEEGLDRRPRGRHRRPQDRRRATAGRSATGSRSRPPSGARRTAPRPGSSTSAASTTADKGIDTTQFLFHYDYFDEARSFGQGIVGWYIVRIADPRQAAAVGKAIDTAVREFALRDQDADREGTGADPSPTRSANIGAIIRWILTAVFFTLLLVAGNTMAQSVRERTNELGGAEDARLHQRPVLALVLAESCAHRLRRRRASGLALGRAAHRGRRSRPAAFCRSSTSPSETSCWASPSSSCWVSSPASCRRSRRCACASSTRCGGFDDVSARELVLAGRRSDRDRGAHHPAAPRRVARHRGRHRRRGGGVRRACCRSARASAKRCAPRARRRTR